MSQYLLTKFVSAQFGFFWGGGGMCGLACPHIFMVLIFDMGNILQDPFDL